MYAKFKLKHMQTFPTKGIKRDQEQSFKSKVHVKANLGFRDKLDLETKCLGTSKCQKWRKV